MRLPLSDFESGFFVHRKSPGILARTRLSNVGAYLRPLSLSERPACHQSPCKCSAGLAPLPPSNLQALSSIPVAPSQSRLSCCCSFCASALFICLTRYDMKLRRKIFLKLSDLVSNPCLTSRLDKKTRRKAPWPCKAI